MAEHGADGLDGAPRVPLRSVESLSGPARARGRWVRGRLYAAFIGLTAVVMIVVAAGLGLAYEADRGSTGRVDDAIALAVHVHRLGVHAADQEANGRAFIATGDAGQLAAYRAAQRAAAAQLDAMAHAASRYPSLAPEFAGARDQLAALDAFFAGRIRRTVAEGGSAARALASRDPGRALVVELRDTADRAIDLIIAEVADARRAQETRVFRLGLLLLVLGVSGLLLAGAIAVGLPRRIGALVEELGIRRTEADATAARAQALQALGAALSPALDRDRVIDTLGRHLAPPLVGAHGQIALAVPGDRRRDVRNLGGGPAPGLDARYVPLVGDALTAGVPRFTASDDETAVLAALPLDAGRRHGMLALRFPGIRTLSASERAFLSVMAEQVAVALERARLHEAQVAIAHTLQRSLLPRSIPSIGGMEVATRYQAAAEGQEVGGDFYDIIAEHPAGGVLVVGDVCGKGPEAAALTALGRHTVRALADGRRSPSAILSGLNDAMLREQLAVPFMTAVVARVRATAGGLLVTLARAGHPYPLLVRSGGAIETIGADTGPLLGVFTGPHFVDVTATLGAGDTLIVYTDGLSEARQGTRLLGDERLQAAASQCAARPVGECADGLIDAARRFVGGPLRDDVALIVLRPDGRG